MSLWEYYMLFSVFCCHNARKDKNCSYFRIGHQHNMKNNKVPESFQPKHTLRDERVVERKNKRRHIGAAETLIQLNKELASQAAKNVSSHGRYSNYMDY